MIICNCLLLSPLVMKWGQWPRLLMAVLEKKLCIVEVYYSKYKRRETLYVQPQKRIGSFGINHDNGSENVTFKMNSRFFNFCCVYSYLLKMANVGEFPWSWLLRSALRFKERKGNSSSLVYVLHKTCNWAFSRRSCARKVKKCTKMWCTCKVVVLRINLLLVAVA